MIIVKKTLVDKIMVTYQIEFINYLYFMLLEIQDLDFQSKKFWRKIYIVNA